QQLSIYLLIFTTSLIVLSALIERLFKIKGGERTALKNSISLMNSGNYGLPVAQLVFSTNPLGVSVQILMLVFQNLLTYTYGLYNLVSASKSIYGIFLSLIRLPIIYALIFGILFQIFEIPLPQFVLIPLEQLAGGFAALALLLLGMQLANIRFTSFHRVIGWRWFGRLFASPAIALAIILLLGIEGVIAPSLLIASAFPTSRNTATLALEYDVAPDLHAQIVLFSTLLSGITVTVMIYLAKLLF